MAKGWAHLSRPYDETERSASCLDDILYFGRINSIIDVGTGDDIELPLELLRKGYKVKCIDSDILYQGSFSYSGGYLKVDNEDVKNVDLTKYDLCMFRRFCDNENALLLNNLLDNRIKLSRNVLIEFCHEAPHYNQDAKLNTGILKKYDEDLFYHSNKEQQEKMIDGYITNMWTACLGIANTIKSWNYKVELKKYLYEEKDYKSRYFPQIMYAKI